MSLTEEEENRIGRLEGEVDVLTKRLDDLINGMVDTIKNHPIWKHDGMSNIKNEEKDKVKHVKEPFQMFDAKEANEFLELCYNLKYCTMEILEHIDQTDHVKDIKNRLREATAWNIMFDLSILGIGEHIRQLKEKGDVNHGK